MVNKFYLLLLALTVNASVVEEQLTKYYPALEEQTLSKAPYQNNDRPVIGILSLPLHPYEDFPVPQDLTTYIAASYVKYVEMAGARVVPLLIDQSFDELEKIAKQLNGILFTGGAANFWKTKNSTQTPPPLSDDYGAKACYLYDLVKKINDNGTYYPLWATCLGFEVINVCANNDYKTIGDFDGEPPYVRRNKFTDAANSSWVFTSYNPEIGWMVMKKMENFKLSLLSHSHGVAPESYKQYKNLSDTYKVLSTMEDKKGKQFIAMIEAKDYPIYGSQFHPEKNLYEWNTAIIPHDEDAVAMSTFLSNFLVSEARRNNNTFESKEELKKYLIYNWDPYFIDEYFVTIYAFKSYSDYSHDSSLALALGSLILLNIL